MNTQLVLPQVSENPQNQVQSQVPVQQTPFFLRRRVTRRVQENMARVLEVIQQRPRTLDELVKVTMLSPMQVKYVLSLLEQAGTVRSGYFGGNHYYFVDAESFTRTIESEVKRVREVLCRDFSSARGCVSKLTEKVARRMADAYMIPYNTWLKAKVKDALMYMGIDAGCVPAEEIRRICGGP